MGYLGKDGKIEGDILKQRHNFKLRPILELLRKDPYINIIGENPIVLQWHPDGRLGDESDVSDVDISDSPCKNEESLRLWRKDTKYQEGDQGTSPTSHTSPRIYRASWTGDVWACRYCGLKGDRPSMEKHDCPEVKPNK